MKKTNYRINLFEGSTTLCDTVVLLAAKSNGNVEKTTLEQLKGVVESESLLYPTANRNTKAEIIGERLLQIDTKIGEEYKTVCTIEMVEIFDLKPTLEPEMN